MSMNARKVFSPAKVNVLHDKVDAYLRGENIYPTTMEIDLTQVCSRACHGCPYGAARTANLTLQLPFLDRLFSGLGPHTPGIVLSGGECTIVPHFAETLALAKRKGFKEVAVISNGARIDVPSIQDALMEHATSIRISLYDWLEGDSENYISTLRKLEQFRNRIEKEGSRLEIAASMLTRSTFNPRVVEVGLQALATGIHWLYFHPYCEGWDEHQPVQADQSGVLDTIQSLMAAAPKEANIQVPYERYDRRPLKFRKLHGSHFLIQVGADGVNYAGPECKYESDSALLDLNTYLEDDWLWHPKRMGRLEEINSDNYRFIGTKHRPPIFSDYIQQMEDARGCGSLEPEREESAAAYAYPGII